MRLGILTLALAVAVPTMLWAQAADDLLEDEKILEEEQDFPDLVRADETGEVMDEFAFLQDDEIESAARHRQVIGMSPAAITVITREDIRTSAATTVPDLLRLVPGMEVVISTPFFISITSRLFWTYENNNYLILIDGRVANVELLGQPFYSAQPLAVEDIERIEIIRGPASSLYGANAFAGVISITTRAIGEESSSSVRIGAGDLGSLRAGGRVNLRFSDFRIALNGAADLARSFTDGTSLGRKTYWMRAVVEYRLSDTEKLLFDGCAAYGKGAMLMGAGSFHTTGNVNALRLAYDSENLKTQLFWLFGNVFGRLTEQLKYSEIVLAEFDGLDTYGNTVDLDVQWTLPKLWEPLLLIVGGRGRISRATDAKLLDAQTFDDIESPNYHQAGLDHWEGRAGGFVHAEYAPVDWITVTAGIRFDYNSESGEFLSPRAAVVLQPTPGQFLRFSAARAFRKPSFPEDKVHFQVNFPTESPLQGESAQAGFREFMSHNIGGEDLHNEELVSVEAGYRGEWMDQRLVVSLDLFCNWYTEITFLASEIVLDQNGLPDLDESRFRFAHLPRDTRFIGGELVVKYNPADNLQLLASWAYREGYSIATGQAGDDHPKNLFTLGGRYISDWGLVSSVYVFSRSDFRQSNVTNPDGILEPFLTQDFDPVLLVFARLGWRASLSDGFELEAGVKWFQPISPFSEPHFRYYEMGGGVTPFGVPYGGEQLQRTLTAYLEGSF